MPGGKITSIQELPDLESFLARKRYPFEKWLKLNNISSVEMLEKAKNNWLVSEELNRLAAELLKPVCVFPSNVPDLIVSEIEQQPQPAVDVVDEETLVTETIASSIPEETSQMVEEASLVLYASPKERKKSR